MTQFPEYTIILDRLENDLPSYLHYHTIAHTLDVYECSKRIGMQEGISPQEMRLLLTAAIYHDSGYIYLTNGHEEKSCEIAREILPKFSYSSEEIDVVCGMIQATRVPQEPKTLLEQIICDADLDYLGRDDFYELGEKLFIEMQEIGSIDNKKDWNNLQAQFLKEHRYFTKTAIDLRKAKKLAHLDEILNKIN
ncbi:MAG: HD domain-containing protein [Flavobacterium sp.]|uniref:HD domain-containing protein n=1 Tax=Flavobacterium sp. TaxID=239 RepID=UPI00121C65AD|nr:HD domain-containing protein [Flavobacterium sp.]RZJ64512.1 MAG: HD domain-containing protein [Flavobacterium sp.]